jgi:hypothetical protein
MKNFTNKHNVNNTSQKHAYSASNIKCGFTLLETIIYLALLTLIIGCSFGAISILISGNSRNQSEIILETEGNFVLAKINWAMTGATTTVVTSDPPTLSVTKNDFGFNPLIFSTSSGALMLKEGGSPSATTTSDNVWLQNLTFLDISASNGRPEGVKTEFTLQTRTDNGVILSQNFEITKYLRK